MLTFDRFRSLCFFDFLLDFGVRDFERFVTDLLRLRRRYDDDDDLVDFLDFFDFFDDDR